MGGAEVSGPVVERTEAGGKEVAANVYGEEAGADGRVDHLAHYAVDLHSLESFIGVVGCERGLLVVPFYGELIEVREPAPRLGRASDGANEYVVTDYPVVDIAVPDDPGGFVPEAEVGAGLPEVGWFYDVGVGGN